MSLRFYKGPKDHRRRKELGEDECARLLARAKTTKEWILPQLSFEEIIKNNTLPPCSLNDFMDYLMYVERQAEPLQFFLWYCDYLTRWSVLAPEEKATAPKWDPEQGKLLKEEAALRPGGKRGKKSRRNPSVEEKSKLGKILDILDREADKKYAHAKSLSSASAASSLPSIPESVADSEAKWIPYSSQPFREDINKIVLHYISASGPRSLPLSKKDRTACLHAVEHTTHPSALLPALTAVEALLRGESHPNFIHWSLSNTNRPLTHFLRLSGLLTTLLGTVLVVVLALSSWSRFFRLLALPLWIFGLATFLAAVDGVCLTLHVRNRRQVRPWDQAEDLEGGLLGSRLSLGQGHGGKKKHMRGDSAASAFSAVDPLRKPSLQSLGPKNEFAEEPWVSQYARKFALWKIWDVTSMSQNESIRVLQTGVVKTALVWAVAISLVMAVGVCFVPNHPILW